MHGVRMYAKTFDGLHKSDVRPPRCLRLVMLPVSFSSPASLNRLSLYSAGKGKKNGLKTRFFCPEPTGPCRRTNHHLTHMHHGWGGNLSHAVHLPLRLQKTGDGVLDLR